MFSLNKSNTPKVWIKKSIALSVFVYVLLPISLQQAQAATPQVVQPSISPNGGSILTKSTITLSTATLGASIYYTINGSTPTTGSYLYNGSVDLQPGANYFTVGSYTVKAIAVKSGYLNSTVAQASFNVANKDQGSRNTLLGYGITINHDDCWNSTKTNCTSLYGMRPATLSEIMYFAQACDKWNKPAGPYANRCGVLVTGGTEAGHAGTGICSHSGGSKFDMSPTSLVSGYATTPAYFTYMGIRSDGTPMYKWKSGGAIYAHESSPNHWDVLVGC